MRAAGYVVGVCVRDHWDELDDSDREWCTDRLIAEIKLQADDWRPVVHMQDCQELGDRPCAYASAILLSKQLTDGSLSRVQDAFAEALIHPVDEVRLFAIAGVGRFLVAGTPEFAIRCANALAEEAMLVEQGYIEEETRLEQDDPEALWDGAWRSQIEGNVAEIVRQKLFTKGAILHDAVARFRPDGWFAADAWHRILETLSFLPTESVTIEAYDLLAQTLPQWWRERHGPGIDRRERSHGVEARLVGQLESFLMRTPRDAAIRIIQPMLDAVGDHPQETGLIVRGLIASEDSDPNTPQFWTLWSLFADKVRHANWLVDINDEHSWGAPMVSAIFLIAGWKNDSRHWASLDGFANNVHALFEELPPGPRILEDYVQFLYDIGSEELPDLFIRIASSLRAG